MKPQDIKCTVFERNFLKFVQYFENTFFLDYLCTMASIGSIEKDSIATTRALQILPCM